MKILVTGFNPFGTDKINPAIEAVKRLPDEIAGAKIIKLEIPTEFGKSADVVHKGITDNHPDYVLDIGQAGGRFGLTLKEWQLTLMMAELPIMLAINHAITQFMKMVKLLTLQNFQ